MLAATTSSLPEAVHDFVTPDIPRLLDERLGLESTPIREAPLPRAVPAAGSLESEVSINTLVFIPGDITMGSNSCEPYRSIASRQEYTIS